MGMGTVALRMAIAIAVVAVGMFIRPRVSHAAEGNLLNNGDFARGSGNSCDGWRVDAWILFADRYRVQVDSAKRRRAGPNLKSTPITITMRAGNRPCRSRPAGTTSALKRGPLKFCRFIGATIGVLEDSVMSANLKRTNDSTKLGFYLRVGPKGADVDVALRVGKWSRWETRL